MGRQLPQCFDYTNPHEYLARVREGFPPMIVCLAVNGGVQGKETNPNLPETADEIADSVAEAYEAGASMVHVHCRDPRHQSQGATRAEDWYEVNAKIRAKSPGIVINNTTGGSLTMTMAERLSCLDGKPEVASLNLTPDMSRFRFKAREAPLPDPHPAGEYDDCIPFSFRQLKWFGGEMKRRGIKPEIETYHTGGAQVIQYLIEEGLVEEPYWIQTVMGYQAASYPTVDNLFHLLRELPRNSLWLCSGIGPHELPMTTLAMIMGGHVRVGFEDNIYYRRGVKADSNAQLVARAVRIARELQREIATPAQTRALLGLSATPSTY